ncbi:MAG: hypothetical protein II792_03590 [Prevotella sp.]|nr:hypothetical protein [Prevotella sp.]
MRRCCPHLNHQCSLGGGWTWERLAQENQKSLAPDSVPSPAGVEPVVRAERIVSTDKKALATGDILKEAATTVFLPSVAARFLCYSIIHAPYMRAFCSLMVSS